MSKTVIITGAAGALGSAVVERFVKDGYKIIITLAPGEKMPAYEKHEQVEKHTLDLLDEAGADALVHQVVKKYGVIDGALLLVGGYTGGTIQDTLTETVKKMFGLNFETAYNMARPVFNQMIQQNSGRIIFMGARPALNAGDGKKNLAYGLSKSLLFKLSEYLNAEAKDKNVVTCVIAPSTMDTPANRNAMPDADFDKWVKTEDVASLMAYLFSDKGAALREPVLKMYGRS